MRNVAVGGLFVVMVIFLIFSACATPSGRTTGQVVDDATITTKVKTKIYADSFLKGIAVGVKTFQGNVTLMGAVDSEEQKQHAESIARSVHGVINVNNLLEIK